MKCPSCGTENPEGSRFCMSCASPLAPGVAPAAQPSVVPPPPPPRLRHKEPHEDIIGLASFAFVLIALATAFALNTNLWADLSQWGHQISTHNTPFIRPPEGVILSAAWFFAVVGVLEFAAAAMRFALRWTYLRVAGRVLSGAGDLVFASLLFLYSAKTISGTFLIAILAGAVGVLLLIYVTLGIYWASARGIPRPEPVPPPAQH